MRGGVQDDMAWATRHCAFSLESLSQGVPGCYHLQSMLLLHVPHCWQQWPTSQRWR